MTTFKFDQFFDVDLKHASSMDAQHTLGPVRMSKRYDVSIGILGKETSKPRSSKVDCVVAKIGSLRGDGSKPCPGAAWELESRSR